MTPCVASLALKLHRRQAALTEGGTSARRHESRYFSTLVQISFLKTLYFGQHNEHWAMVYPIIRLNTLSLRFLIGEKPILCYFGQHYEFVKKEEGNLILKWQDLQKANNFNG